MPSVETYSYILPSGATIEMENLPGRGAREVSADHEGRFPLEKVLVLYGQLAGLFGELLFPEGAKPDQEDYRDRIAAGWERIANRPERPFLLVIDGVDEASGDWLNNRVLPYTIPPNLAIVLAARYKPGQRNGHAWLHEFVFAPQCTRDEPLELQPLSKEAVGEAVAQLGHPLDTLPEREGILNELYRLTDRGDPLLINLWVGQLWKKREQAPALTAAELQKLEPSFAGFLDVWMKEQEAVWKAQGIRVHPDDFNRLLRIFALQANLDRSGRPYHLGQELRCWLIRASIFSRTENMPPELIVALVKEGEWSGQ